MSRRDDLISRRELLKRAGAAVVIGSVPIGSARLEADQGGRSPDSLTAAEADTLDAICARLIPTDENGPGAREAQAWRYIDRALGGYLAPSRETYTAGLADIDRRATDMRGMRFAALSPADQDEVLRAIEATPFFSLVRGHTIQGTFCDPFYGGNADFVGWDLLGYPGVRTIVTADEQKMGIAVKPNHKSAYDYVMFHKASDR